MTSEVRTRTMRAVKSRDTKPELFVRKIVYALGYRYRLHRKDLPGCPDLVFPGRRKVIFVHGCFWHGHNCKRGGRVPKENMSYWREKIAKNIERDKKHIDNLNKMGWNTLLLWECDLKGLEVVKREVKAFLDKV